MLAIRTRQSSATRFAPRRSQPDSRIANSSPPRRPRWSTRRQNVRQCSATFFKAQSPVSWPKRSLIDLKWSRSNITSATSSPALAACPGVCSDCWVKWWRLRSEEHTSELQSLMRISYAVFCLKKKKKIEKHTNRIKQKNIKRNKDKKQTQRQP